jgi:hypothetical protein
MSSRLNGPIIRRNADASARRLPAVGSAKLRLARPFAIRGMQPFLLALAL